MNALLGKPKNLHSLHVWSLVQVYRGIRSRGDEDRSIGRNRKKKFTKERIIRRIGMHSKASRCLIPTFKNEQKFQTILDMLGHLSHVNISLNIGSTNSH